MTSEQIMERFDSVKSRSKFLEQQQKVLRLRQVLNDEILKENKLLIRVDKEENKVANSLDREYPKWRNVLIEAVRKAVAE